MHVRAHAEGCKLQVLSAGRMCMELLLLDGWAARLATYVVLKFFMVRLIV